MLLLLFPKNSEYDENLNKIQQNTLVKDFISILYYCELVCHRKCNTLVVLLTNHDYWLILYSCLYSLWVEVYHFNPSYNDTSAMLSANLHAFSGNPPSKLSASLWSYTLKGVILLLLSHRWWYKSHHCGSFDIVILLLPSFTFHQNFFKVCKDIITIFISCETAEQLLFCAITLIVFWLVVLVEKYIWKYILYNLS